MEKKQKKVATRGATKVATLPPKSRPLSEQRKAVLEMLTIEKLTPRQITIRSAMHKSRVYRHIEALIKLGFMDRHFNTLRGGDSYINQSSDFSGVGSRAPPAKLPEMWELHAASWRVEIIEGGQEKKYLQKIGDGVGHVEILDCTIEMYKDVIVIYHNGFFRSDNPDGAIIKSWEHLWRVLAVIERDNGLMLRKDRKNNIRRFRGHFPRVNDELAQAANGETIKVYALDGKLRFHVDWSKKKVPEAEFLHSSLGAEDARKYERFIRDLIEHEHFLPSEATQYILGVQQMNLGSAKIVDELSYAVKTLLATQTTTAVQVDVLAKILVTKFGMEEGEK